MLLLLFGSAVGLALAEITVRLVDPHARDHVLPGGFFTMDTVIGWRQHPDHTVTHRTRYFSTTYTTNARGYRDVERDQAPAPGRTRVLVFGDSQVFGWGVPQGRRFTDLLESRHPEFEVWNLAVMGYGFDQQMLEYDRWGEAWHPDVVVLFATSYTLGRAETGYIYRKHKPRFVLRGPDSLVLVPPAGRATAFTEFAYRLASPWYLPYFVERRLAALRPSARPRTPGLAAALLTRVARTAEARGHRLVLLTTLAGDTLEEVRRVGEERGFGVVPVVLPGDRSAFVLGPKDAHWNERAHDRVAEILWEGLAPATAPARPARRRSRSQAPPRGPTRGRRRR